MIIRLIYNNVAPSEIEKMNFTHLSFWYRRYVALNKIKNDA